MHTLHKWFLTFLLIPSLCQALPLGFGRNQGDLKYAELLSPNFYVYHDARAPHEARVILEALEAARPKLENWIGVRRKDPLKVILSSTSANASFANFITDAIELQTLARGGRDLAWHEYVHSTMYRHLDGIFGPAGSIIHLPWMPAWWIEGLAETLSVSNGSDIQNGIERQFALNGDWPSYDKLHALYDDGRFSTIGYAISGAFVSYILRTGDANRLPEMLETFYKYSMPWYWPWSFVPFAKFMPMDEALTAFTGKRGIELYEDYKAAASQYWQAQKDLTFIKYSGKGLDLSIPQSQSAEPKSNGLPGESIGFSSSYSLQTRGDNVYFLRRSGDELFEAQAKFENGVAENFEKTWILPSDALIPRIHRQQESIYLTQETDQDISVKQSVWLLKDNKKTKLFDRLAGISELFLSADKLIWLEEFLEHDQICWVPRARLAEAKRIKQVDIHCPISAEYPKTLNIIGSRSLVAADGQDESSEIWLNRTEETIMGDRYQLQRWTLADDKLHNVPMNFGGKPLSVAFNGQDTWLALADRKQHFLRRLDPKAQCLEEHELANIITRLHNSLDNQLILSLWQSNSNILVKTDAQKMPSHPCRLHDEPSSPLLRAMLDGDKPLKSIIADSSPWQNRTETTTRNDQQKITQASILGLQKGSASKSELNSQPYVWRGRPVFAFPWIGYDPQGLSYGIISVPLMDHLQNETAQLTALYGAASHYPDIQLGFTSNRFNTSFGLDLYRKQTWNGVFAARSYYFDERGAELSASRYFSSLDIGMRIAYKNSWMLPYLGDPDIWQASAPNGKTALAQGFLREINISLYNQQHYSWSTLSTSLNSAIASKLYNGNYDYDQLGGSLNLSIPLSIFNQPSIQSWGTSYSRVRGGRRKLLREAYRPLYTYVPGSGGGLNEINTPLYGPAYLTSAQYADTQGRLQFSWTTPLVADIAKLIHIVYLQRLDATAFINYGRAWAQQIQPRFDSGLAAHGYKLDLQADVKGVKLNIGLGTGQVIGKEWEVFGLIGFDALIDQNKH